MLDVFQIGFIILSFLAYCAGLWYEYYKVVRDYKQKETEEQP